MKKTMQKNTDDAGEEPRAIDLSTLEHVSGQGRLDNYPWTRKIARHFFPWMLR